MFKQKHKNIPLNAPRELWFKESFDFVVPHSLEDYCSYIETFDQGLFSGYRVYLSSIDQRRIEFTISRSAGKSGTVWAVGYLEAVEDQLTRIVGKAGVPVFDIQLLILILVVMGFVIGLDTVLSHGLSAVCILGVVIIALSSVIGGSLWWTRDGLIDKLVDV